MQVKFVTLRGISLDSKNFRQNFLVWAPTRVRLLLKSESLRRSIPRRKALLCLRSQDIQK